MVYVELITRAACSSLLILVCFFFFFLNDPPPPKLSPFPHPAPLPFNPAPLPPAVPSEIALPVPVDIELAHTPRTGDGILENAGEDGPSLPVHVLGHADVHGEQGPRR